MIRVLPIWRSGIQGVPDPNNDVDFGLGAA